MWWSMLWACVSGGDVMVSLGTDPDALDDVEVSPGGTFEDALEEGAVTTLCETDEGIVVSSENWGAGVEVVMPERVEGRYDVEYLPVLGWNYNYPGCGQASETAHWRSYDGDVVVTSVSGGIEVLFESVFLENESSEAALLDDYTLFVAIEGE